MENNQGSSNSLAKLTEGKYQYFTGAIPNVNSIATSSIDRNSIEQRIANLQAKIAQKKYNPEQSLSDSYPHIRRAYQYGMPKETSNLSKPHQHNLKPDFEIALQQLSKKSPHSKNLHVSPKQREKKFNYLGKLQESENLPLKQKYKFNLASNNIIDVSSNTKQNYGHYKGSKDSFQAQNAEKFEPKIEIVLEKNRKQKHETKDKKIKKNLQQKNIKFHEASASSSVNQRKLQNLSAKIDQSLNGQVSQHPQQIKINAFKSFKQGSFKNHQLFEDKFAQLNKTVSNLNQSPNLPSSYSNPVYDKFSKQSETITFGHKRVENELRNNELYEMMKNIMIGQERLQKQLIKLKNNNRSLFKQEPATPYADGYQKNQNLQKNAKPISAIISKSFQTTGTKQMPTKDPQTAQKSKKKLEKISNEALPLSQIQNSSQRKPNKPNNQLSAKKPKRVASAEQSKKVGKITKNKEQFFELYKQAKTNKRLCTFNNRIIVSSEVVSSVWDKIKCTIQRTSAQDQQSSVIYHENNRFVNDHLVNSIELQKKLKNDLIKKVYEMCESKCLFK